MPPVIYTNNRNKAIALFLQPNLENLITMTSVAQLKTSMKKADLLATAKSNQALLQSRATSLESRVSTLETEVTVLFAISAIMTAAVFIF